MKVIIVALAFVAAAAAASVGYVENVVPQTLRSKFEQQQAGGYLFGFETDNGITRGETGEIKEVYDEEKKPHSVVVVRGSWTYTNPDGKVETIKYVADENGFRAEGDSVPKLLEPVSRR